MRIAKVLYAEFWKVWYPIFRHRGRMSGNFRIDFNASIQEALGGIIDLSDLEAIRLVLRGNSVIDWNRANFRNLQEADRFLKLHCFDLKDIEDHRRLHYLHQSALTYLEEQIGLRFPDDLRKPPDIREIFVIASKTGGFRRRQILACAILKLMHVIHHMEAAELRYQVPLSEAILLDLAARRIEKAAQMMRDSGMPIVAFYGSRKARNSIITKLLAKRENIAATVFDKLRFRIVTESIEHVLPAFTWLTRQLFPFNYVIPGESHNNLMRFNDLINISPCLGGNLSPTSNGIDEEDLLISEDNTFSGSSYRMINFIIDFPVRIDHLVEIRRRSMLGRVVYVMVEFQIVDQETADLNERGDNAHALYKSRQLDQVRARLRKGGRRKRKKI